MVNPPNGDVASNQHQPGLDELTGSPTGIDVGQFRDFEVRQWWAAGLISLCGLSEIVGAVHSVFVLNIVGRVRAGESVDESIAQFADLVAALAGGILGLAYIAGTVMFCCWFYRVYRNATLLSANKPPMSPGWAVGYFFIPILCLFRPFQAAKFAWVECARVASPERPSRPVLVALWWIAWIVSNIIAQVTFRLAMTGSSSTDPTLEEIEMTSRAELSSSVAGLVSAVLCVAFIVRMSALQQSALMNIGARRGAGG